MSEPVYFVAGMATGVVVVYFVAKALRPTIREKLSDIASDNIIRAVQSTGIPTGVIPPRDTLKRVLLYPAIDEALNAAWL